MRIHSDPVCLERPPLQHTAMTTCLDCVCSVHFSTVMRILRHHMCEPMREHWSLQQGLASSCLTVKSVRHQTDVRQLFCEFCCCRLIPRLVCSKVLHILCKLKLCFTCSQLLLRTAYSFFYICVIF